MELKTNISHTDEETDAIVDDNNVVFEDEFHDNLPEIHNIVLIFYYANRFK